jgi:H+/Cl- antiporter ClcA
MPAATASSRSRGDDRPEVEQILRHVISRIRRNWPAVEIMVRGDSHFIPHVEAVLNEQIPQAPFHLICVKFFGGVLAIGSGLALGREGPSVQMGASVAHFVGKVFRREWPECRVLLAAGVGAGLATAFNAPMAGAVFVLEELVRRFELRIAVAALGASATAIACFSVMRLISMSMRLPTPAPERDRSS